MDELQEMREQMAALKEKLNKQEIVNENNLRKLLGDKVRSWRNVHIGQMIFVGLVCIAISWYDDWDFVWSGLCVYFLIGFIFRIIELCNLRPKNIISEDLKSVLLRLRRVRKREKGPWIFRGMVVLFILQFADYVIKRFQMKAGFCKWDLIILLVIGFVSLMDYLFWKYCIQKQPSQWDEYIRQIEEMSESDEEKEAVGK